MQARDESLENMKKRGIEQAELIGQDNEINKRGKIEEKDKEICNIEQFLVSDSELEQILNPNASNSRKEIASKPRARKAPSRNISKALARNTSQPRSPHIKQPGPFAHNFFYNPPNNEHVSQRSNQISSEKWHDWSPEVPITQVPTQFYASNNHEHSFRFLPQAEMRQDVVINNGFTLPLNVPRRLNIPTLPFPQVPGTVNDTDITYLKSLWQLVVQERYLHARYLTFMEFKCIQYIFMTFLFGIRFLRLNSALMTSICTLSEVRDKDVLECIGHVKEIWGRCSILRRWFRGEFIAIAGIDFINDQTLIEHFKLILLMQIDKNFIASEFFLGNHRLFSLLEHPTFDSFKLEELLNNVFNFTDVCLFSKVIFKVKNVNALTNIYNTIRNMSPFTDQTTYLELLAGRLFVLKEQVKQIIGLPVYSQTSYDHLCSEHNATNPLPSFSCGPK